MSRELIDVLKFAALLILAVVFTAIAVGGN